MLAAFDSHPVIKIVAGDWAMAQTHAYLLKIVLEQALPATITPGYKLYPHSPFSTPLFATRFLPLAPTSDHFRVNSSLDDTRHTSHPTE